MKALSVFSTFLTTLFTLSLTVSAQEPQKNETQAAFVYDLEYGILTFAATAVRETDRNNGGDGDFFFHMEAPAENSWAAVGVGTEMKGALIWVLYRSKNGTGVTLCSRVTDRNIEPAHYEESGCALDWSEGKENKIMKLHNNTDYFVANVHCKKMVNRYYPPTLSKREDQFPLRKNRTHKVDYEWPGHFDLPKLDLSSAAQPFIYALGPADRRLRSDAKGVPLRRHVIHGHFTMDMTKASVDTAADVSHKELKSNGTWQMRNTKKDGDFKEDFGGWEGTIHAVLMSSTIVVLFPVGVIFLRILNQVKPHAWLQGIGCVFMVVGVGIGIWAGMSYNQTRKVNNYHQIIGLCVAAATLIQFGLGFAHHLIFTRKHRKSVLGRIHVPLGSCILIVGAVNGFLGFKITSSGFQYIIFAVIVAFVFIGTAVALYWIKVVKKKEYRQTADRKTLDAGFEAYRHTLIMDPDEVKGALEQQGHAHQTGQTGIMLHQVPRSPPPDTTHDNGRPSIV